VSGGKESKSKVSGSQYALSMFGGGNARARCEA
jgi:hypothetical protein